MKKTLSTLAVALVCAGFLSACGGGDDANSLAAVQAQSFNNASANASITWPAGTYTVTPDPTVTLQCPAGSGFANVTLTNGTYATCATYASGRPCVIVAAPVEQSCNPHLH